MSFIVSIVGSAGRMDDAERISISMYNQMLAKAIDQIQRVWKLDPKTVILQSGGGAFADHLIVSLHRLHPTLYSRLILHLPAPINEEGTAFAPAGIGATCNSLHRQFSEKMNWNPNQSLLELALLSQQSDKLDPNIIVDSPALSDPPPRVSSFFQRNTAVAQCDYLLAFTFIEGPTPKRGGTYDTFQKCKGVKVHINLIPMETRESLFDAKKGAVALPSITPTSVVM